MKQSTRFPLLACCLLILCSLSAQAGEMNYQGRLTDANGNPLADGAYVLTFRIYNAATNGTLVWGPFVTDGNTGNGRTANAQLVNGRFNVVLGPRDTSARELSTQFLGGDRFLEIQVGGASPVSPRQKLLHAPLALHADTADHATTATAIGNPGSSNVINIQNTRVGINTATPEATLHINSNIDADATILSQVGAVMIGGASGSQLLLDNNEILARSVINGVATPSVLYLGSGGSETRLYGNNGVHFYNPGIARQGFTVNGSDNNGSSAAFTIAAGFGNLLMDGNEIDNSSGILYINSNVAHPVQIGGSNSPESNGSNGALNIRNGTSSMWLDGNEIDSNGTLYLNSNNTSGVQVGDNVGPAAPEVGSRFNVNNSGYSNVTLSVRGNASHSTPFLVENFIGSTLFRVNTSGIQVYGSAAKNDGDPFWASFSDRRLKQNISPFQKGLAEIKQLNTVNFNYIDNPELGLTSDRQNVGLIAQEVREVFPEAVTEDPDGHLNLNINAIHWAAINAIKELAAESAALRAENAALRQRLDRLEAAP